MRDNRTMSSVRLLVLMLTATVAIHPQSSDLAARLAKFKTVQMPFHSDGLTPREKEMVDKLVHANQLLDDVYWRQSDIAGLDLYKSTKDPALKSLLMIMGGRWDLIDRKQALRRSASHASRS